MKRTSAVGSLMALATLLTGLLAGCGAHDASDRTTRESAVSESPSTPNPPTRSGPTTASASPTSPTPTGPTVAPATGTRVSVGLASLRLLPGWTVSTRPGGAVQSFQSMPRGIYGNLSVTPGEYAEATPPAIDRLAKAVATTMRGQKMKVRRLADVTIDGTPFVHLVGHDADVTEHDYATVRHGKIVTIAFDVFTIRFAPARAAGLDARILASVDLT